MAARRPSSSSRVVSCCSAASALELLDDPDRRLDADVGEDQGLFDLFPELVGDAVEHDRAKVLAQRPAGLAEVLAQPAEQPAALLVFVLDRRLRQPGLDNPLNASCQSTQSLPPRGRSLLGHAGAHDLRRAVGPIVTP
jgi:hypothetical protein